MVIKKTFFSAENRLGAERVNICSYKVYPHSKH